MWERSLPWTCICFGGVRVCGDPVNVDRRSCELALWCDSLVRWVLLPVGGVRAVILPCRGEWGVRSVILPCAGEWRERSVILPCGGECRERSVALPGGRVNSTISRSRGGGLTILFVMWGLRGYKFRGRGVGTGRRRGDSTPLNLLWCGFYIPLRTYGFFPLGRVPVDRVAWPWLSWSRLINWARSDRDIFYL